MPSSNVILLTMLGCGLATWLSRIIPFVLLKHFQLPKQVVEFLSFVPIVIMTTLWFSSLFTAHMGHLPKINLPYALASVPTFLSAILSKSLLIIVLVGVLSLMLLRIFGF
ncbi:MAG: AzlD domain-containing protein [Oenococcus sp.]|uniref:AzlD domain-containing protein n=1 Tax=Oenococcus TaxID=46254 RepID=UPI0021E7A3B2|nr:AzlD domain-containing protein [Oenococcus kitaharae]MCV3295899.1 AzlD domain-containing protein [Oenococcus kitaharae]